MESAGTLRIDLKPSLWLAGLLGTVHALALVAVCLSLGGWPRFLVVSGVLLSGLACVVETRQRSLAAAVSLQLNPDGRASWRDRSGRWHEGRLEGGQFVSAALVVLSLRRAELRRKWLVLAPDSASTDELRRLRVWLRWRAEASPDERKAADPT